MVGSDEFFENFPIWVENFKIFQRVKFMIFKKFMCLNKKYCDVVCIPTHNAIAPKRQKNIAPVVDIREVNRCGKTINNAPVFDVREVNRCGKIKIDR